MLINEILAISSLSGARLGISGVVQIVVFATRPHTSLRRHRSRIAALVVTQENVFELHHAGVRKQQCRVVSRHQWRARDDLMVVVTKKLQECLA